MKTNLKSALMLSFALTLSLTNLWGSGRAVAQAPGDPIPPGFRQIVILNEYCEGMFSRDGMNYVRLDCVIEIDPLSGLPVPCFHLPVPVVAGDVLVVDDDGTVGDLLRFPDFTGQGVADRVYFFSERDDQEPNPPPSDVGIPSFFQDNQAVVGEVGDEGLNTFTYSTPRAVYFGVSDFDLQP